MKHARDIQYDYTNQAWIVDGVYDDCGHPQAMTQDGSCRCYGRLHAGEQATNIH